jgi:hypothetical protein
MPWYTSSRNREPEWLPTATHGRPGRRWARERTLGGYPQDQRGHALPRNEFVWSNLPPELLRALALDLRLITSDPAAALRAEYGTPADRGAGARCLGLPP